MWFGRKGPKRLSIAVQANHLKRLFPASEVSLVGNSVLVWIGHLTPSPLSDIYKVRMKYRIGERPDVNVLEPSLKSRADQPLPHVFTEERLCLFMFSHKEWNPGMIIAATIIPWTCLWLFYYEIWFTTGEWRGGGEHPPNNQPSIRELAAEAESINPVHLY